MTNLWRERLVPDEGREMDLETKGGLGWGGGGRG